MLLALLLAFTADPPAADPRAELLQFSARLEERLGAACRPAEPMAFLSGLPETRYVYIEGMGAVLLLPPRALPLQVTLRTGEPGKPEVSASGRLNGGQIIIKSTKPADLTDIEARIRETRKEAERMRAQAEAAFADAERQLRVGLGPSLASMTGDGGPGGAWSASLLFDDAPIDNRPPEQVEKEVAEALLDGLLADGPALKGLQPTDSVTLSVELVSRPQPWVKARAFRTVTLRAVKGDLDAFAKGGLKRDDLLKKIQIKTY